jgi:KaiC/GvpD/RAD55 family RecA-like ATPase
MRIHPDGALKNFERISKVKLDDPTEADTRSKIIDPILKECLDWQSSDVFREECAHPGYVDYVLKQGNRNVLIIEAKREGCSFKLPITFGFLRHYTLGGILSKEKTISDVICQARRYCSDKGTRYGMITNGDQYIVFEAEKNGKDWQEGNCRVFYNFDDIRRNFMDFWNLLSKDGVEAGSLVNELSKGSEKLRFIKPVDDVHFTNEFEPRNELYSYLIPIINRTLKEITDPTNLEMLKECYVIDNEFEEAGKSLHTHFKQSLEKSSFKEIRQGEEHAGIFHMDFYDKMELLRKSPQSPIICMLLGGIGSGKTTFIFRFFNLVLDEDERKRVKWFYVDFRTGPREEKDIREYILKGILQEFIFKYHDLLISYMQKLKIDKVEPTLDEISRLFSILNLEGNAPCLVIDNVDQHIVESPTYHESVFLEANNLTKELGTITVMTLREESYYESTFRGGVFNAYYIEQYKINPPDLQKLLLLRLRFILNKLELPKDDFQKWLTVNLDLGPRLAVMKEFLNVVEDTLQERAYRSVSRFISRTCGGDMRRALELFASFLVSGNTKILEILDTLHREGSYIIAEHQFVKSIVLGNYRYYSKKSSYLQNMFDFDQRFCQSHFLKLKILNYAEDQLAVDSPYGGGYLTINGVSEEASNISISREAIEDALLQMAKNGLVTLNTRSKDDLAGASHFKITECGVYFLHVLIARFSYVDLVLADTPIADVDLALAIRHLLPSRDLNNRFDRTERFLRYLAKMEHLEFQNSPEYESSPFGKYKFTGRMLRKFESEKKYIIETRRRKGDQQAQAFW